MTSAVVISLKSLGVNTLAIFEECTTTDACGMSHFASFWQLSLISWKVRTSQWVRSTFYVLVAYLCQICWFRSR